jgi:DNA-binding CsgD family transcriptional regulator
VVGAEFLREWVLHDVVRLGPLSDVVGEVAAELAEVAARCDGLLDPLLVRHAVASAVRGAGGLDAVAAEFAALGNHLWGPRPPPRPHGCTARPDGRARPSRRQLGQTGYARAARACVPRARPSLHACAAHPREREVAGLAARGMSDRDIAARLQVSVRTVHSHLHRTYHKLGISDRTELTRLLCRLWDRSGVSAGAASSGVSLCSGMSLGGSWRAPAAC